MKRFLIVGDRSFTDDEVHKMQEFGGYLSDVVAGFATVDTVSIDKIVFTMRKGAFEAVAPEQGIDLKNYDAIYVRSLRVLGCYVSSFAAYHGIACINDYSGYYNGSKAAQTVVFLENGVDFIPTFYAVDNRILADYVTNEVGFPFILKTNTGSQGNSNYLIKTSEDVGRVLAEEPEVDFIAQEYCPNDRDYRLLVVGNKSLLFERRGQAGSHLNNTSKGGSAAQLPNDTLPAEIYVEAGRVAKRLGLIVAGFDVVPKLGTDELYFLEINSQPQLRTGMLLDEKKALLRELFESF